MGFLKRNVVHFVVLSFFGFLYGCGSDGSNSDPNNPGSGVNAEYLSGTWVKECVDNGGNTFITKVVDFDDTGIINLSDYIYADAGCFADLLDTYRLTGRYTLGGDVTTTTGEIATEIDVTMFEEDGVAIPVNFQRTGYRILYVDGDYLYAGDEETDPNLDGTTPARRSNILETVPYVFRSGGFNPNPLIGTWVDTCLDNGDGTYDRETLVISESSMRFTIGTYSDSLCSNLSVSDAFSVAYSLGFSVFTQGVTALELDLIANGEVFYSLIYYDGTSLYFGEHDATYTGFSEATRAINIDFSNPSTRQ